MDYCWDDVKNVLEFETRIDSVYIDAGEDFKDVMEIALNKVRRLSIRKLICAVIVNYERTNSPYLDGGTVERLKKCGYLFDHRCDNPFMVELIDIL